MLIREFQHSDLSDAADIADAAFSRDELFAWIYSRYNLYPGTVSRWWLQTLRQRMNRPGVKMFVAEIDGVVVGYSAWKRVGQNENARKWMDDSIAREILQPPGQSSGPRSDEAIFSQFLGSTSTKKLAKTGFLHLSQVAVSPQHQREGIGKELIKWGFQIATEEMVPVTLEASKAGGGLYLQLGFQIFEQQKISEELDGIAMLWEPDGLQGKWLEVDQDGNAKLRDLS